MTYIEKIIISLLKKLEIDYLLTEHEAVFTCEQESKIFNCSTDHCAKSILIKLNNGDYILAVVPGNQRINIKKIAKLENTKGGRLAHPEEVKKLLGCEVGSVPPFGHKKKIKTYLDKTLLSKDFVLINPGTHSKTIKIKGEYLKKLIRDPIIYNNA
ncbi:MAG: YbaK/EbsC family protein [Promethearchaeota archaeon]